MPDIDVVVGIYPKSRKLSFRTNHDDVDVSELAKSFGGGGHRNIAGATLDKENFMRILKVYYGTDVEGI
jgi:oligoribonuclease NrnB/cAMP/cGMP phosphodiesterase (DHH superfamily)